MTLNEKDRKNFKVFVDFDGTITNIDVGENFLLEFGDELRVKTIVKDWLDGKITSAESWIQMLDTVENFNDADFGKFLESAKVDPTFFEFIKYCEENDFDVFVVSDGLDIYIKKILERDGLSRLKLYSNKAKVINNKIIPEFPHGDEECKLCGNCKRNHIINHSSDDDYTVYIGDGNSDVCPAQYCDFIFAKNSLLKFCERERISYSPFGDFSDVIGKMEKYKSTKRLKKRKQAELKRREIYLQG